MVLVHCTFKISIKPQAHYSYSKSMIWTKIKHDNQQTVITPQFAPLKTLQDVSLACPVCKIWARDKV